LLDNKADTKIRSQSGETPLDIAKKGENFNEIQSLFIKNWAD